VLESSDIESFDLWHVLHVPLTVGAQSVPLKDIGSIQKRHTNVDISKSKQTYEINVCYDFVGSYELVRRVSEEAVDHMNDEILPVGYKAENPSSGWFNNNKDRYAWLIFLIIAAIYVMLSITLESLRLPFAVILMIPVSFIGLFLVFGLSDLSFDQGGFAAFVMLCGIVVNAGIYIIMAFQRHSVHDVRSYVKAFSVKITPIMLTIISTVLGLIPFLTDGPQEVFWFDFAVGTIGGMLFSIVALVFVLPVFALRNPR
jgi:multidrug efflux pump subunit AcrB